MVIEDVKSRLGQLGYTPEAADDPFIQFVVDKITNEIKAECNVEAVPEEMEQTAIDMAVAEFLLAKKNTGQDIGIDVSAVKAITEGDTSVQFGASADGQVNGLLDYFLAKGRSKYASFRRVKW